MRKLEQKENKHIMAPVTKQSHNLITDTSAHNIRNARTHTLWQRCLVAIALLTTCVLGVKAEEKYVIYYDDGTTKYYMANVGGTLTSTTTYNAATCDWEGTSGGTFSNNGKNICFAASTGNEAIVSLDGTSRNLTIDNDGICYINPWYSFYLYYKNNSFYATNSAQLYGNTRVKAEVAEATPPTEPDDNLLVEAKNNAKNTLISKTPGAAVCQYTYTVNGQSVTDASLIETAIDNATTIEEVNVIAASASINKPVPGKYYRIKSYTSGNYLDGVNCYNGTNRMGLKSTAERSEQGSIFYLDEDYCLQNLATQTYTYNTHDIGATKSNAESWTFTESTRTSGCLTLRSSYSGSKELHDSDGNRADRCSSICGEKHDFVLEEVTLNTPEPRFVASSDFQTFTLTCTENEGVIYYTTDGSDPTVATSNRTVLTVGQGVSFSATSGLTIIAYAHKDGYEPSAVVTQVMNINTIDTAEKLASITGNGIYVITADITVTSHVSITNFTGLLDGGYHTISELNAPLFASANGATIRNVVLDEVKITGGTGNVGAIVGTASGATRIYNCGVLSGSIGGGTNVGSIAGRINDEARVINCYSYANITGGTTVGGIVGNNVATYTAGAPKTLVMNCAYYGQLTGGTNKYPIFGGNNITNNLGENTYNFFRYDESTTYAGYNAAQAIFKDEYLDRFGFYQRILDSHRELAAYYAFNDVSKVDEIGKWTLDKTRAPYPIVTKHLSNTRKTLDRTIPNTQEDYAGKKIKDINVTININGTQVYNGTLPVTDMDTVRWDYTYGKIVLPFANEFTGWSIGDAQAITGWKISTSDYYHNQNNIFDNKNYVYAQGGNYIVPEGVESITLTAYVAPAVYLSDANYDVVYNSSYTNSQGRGGATPTTYKGQMVHNSLSSAINALKLTSNETRPYEQAIVMVGNYHYNQKIESDVLPQSTISSFYTNKPFTLMSADKDNDQEPDYCFYQYHAHGSGRTLVHPARFDFLAAPGIGMAAHIEGASAVPSIGIWHCKGWFELTETYLGIMQECEIRPANFLTGSPWILNGGIFEEINMSSTHEYYYENSVNSKLTYMRIGGNVYINNFYPGTQSIDATFTTPLKPICMSGGEVVSCYMTGKQAQKSNTSGSVNFYCNGGYIHEFLGAYLEPLAANQDINIRVDHALIDNFYGGGANENQVTPGNINITINNSHIGFFCGGPKFGNMVNGKNVTINAVGTTFGEFYGGGYGGTALTRSEVKGETVDFTSNRPYNLNFQSYYTDQRLKYDANLGIPVNYALQYFMYAGGGGRGVQKFNVDYARLSLAAVLGNINANLTDCTILNNYYGGGCQGSVTGNITSTLSNCKVHGSAFAGGYTANATPCLVATTQQPAYSEFIISLGFFTPFGEAQTEEFYWKPSDGEHEVGSSDDTNKYLYTSEEKFTRMGEVDGNTTIEIKGANSHIHGSVFGGGNASKVKGSTKVHIKDGRVDGNVFGAGNQASVEGKTDVIIGDDKQ